MDSFDIDIPLSCGQRLVPSCIDEIACSDPARPFVSVPNSADPVTGFNTVTFSVFAGAVNSCSWWIEKELGKSSNFETLFYAGAQDLLYPIFLLAAVKTGHKALFSSPRNSVKAHQSLVNATQCKTIVLGKKPDPTLETFLKSQPSLRIIQIPKVDHFLRHSIEEKITYEYTKTFAQARHEPFAVFHTSGSTGIPKPVIMTHGTFTAMDACQLIPSRGGRATYIERMRDTRFFSGFPLFHTAGCSHLFKVAFIRGLVPVLPPPVPLTAKIIDSTHRYGNVQGSIMPPFFLTELVENPDSCARLGRLQYIGYSGGTLAKQTGDGIPPTVKLMTFYGTTEAATYPIELHDDEWEYMRYSPFFGHEYRQHDGKLFELVLIRNENLQLFQGVFATFPDCHEYHTKDLYSKHPSKPDLWIYRGRSDDIISFLSAEKFNPVDMERTISAHPSVQAAIVAGQGRPQASLLIEPKQIPTTNAEKEELLSQIWPSIDRANQDCPAHARIMKDFIIFSTMGKPMTWTGKETVTRKQTIERYTEELDSLYAMRETIDEHPQQRVCTSITGSQSLLDYIHNLTILKAGQDRVSIDTNFFEMGFDSLQVAATTRQINSFIVRFRPDLNTVSNEEIYRNPSVRMLEAAIARSRRQEEGREIDVNGDEKSDNDTDMVAKLFTQSGLRTMFSFFLNLVGL